MATTIRDGGKNPLIEDSLENSVKVRLLEAMYDHRAGTKRFVFWPYVQTHLDQDRIQSEFGRKAQELDVLNALLDMIADGWVKMLSKDMHDNAHPHLFALTAEGYDRISEHVFP